MQALLQLVTDLNDPGRWYAMRMRVQGNVVGADSVLLWQTGYPFAVNMARGYARYNPGEFSVQGMLERYEADACLIVGSDTLGWLSPQAFAHLRQIPTVVLDPPIRTQRSRRPFNSERRFPEFTSGDGLSHGRDPCAAAPGSDSVLSERRTGAFRYPEPCQKPSSGVIPLPSRHS